MTGSGDPNEATVRLWFAKFERDRVFAFNQGSQPATIRDVLKSRQINARFCPEQGVTLKQGMIQCTPGSPGIARVQWSSGVRHWVVVVGPVGNQFVYLDPWFGVVHCPRNSFPNYSGAGGTFNVPGGNNGTIITLCLTY